jgi:hypothetical protein
MPYIHLILRRRKNSKKKIDWVLTHIKLILKKLDSNHAKDRAAPLSNNVTHNGSGREGYTGSLNLI